MVLTNTQNWKNKQIWKHRKLPIKIKSILWFIIYCHKYIIWSYNSNHIPYIRYRYTEINAMLVILLKVTPHKLQIHFDIFWVSISKKPCSHLIYPEIEGLKGQPKMFMKQFLLQHHQASFLLCWSFSHIAIGLFEKIVVIVASSEWNRNYTNYFKLSDMDYIWQYSKN